MFISVTYDFIKVPQVTTQLPQSDMWSSTAVMPVIRDR